MGFACTARASAESQAFDLVHAKWNEVLHQYVVESRGDSRVRYAKLKADREKFDAYLRTLEGVAKSDFDRFSKPQQLAFLINAYNAFTIKLVIENYPIASIKDTGSFLKSPWKKRFFSLLRKERTLDEIEHEMIRPVFNEPRIHFALVCASAGCPPLRTDAFTATKLEQQLEDSANGFMSDKTKNRFSGAGKKLELSSIFKWYGDDFRKKFGSVEKFVAPKLTGSKADQEAIEAGKISISYLDYDWSLNDAR